MGPDTILEYSVPSILSLSIWEFLYSIPPMLRSSVSILSSLFILLPFASLLRFSILGLARYCILPFHSSVTNVSIFTHGNAAFACRNDLLVGLMVSHNLS